MLTRNNLIGPEQEAVITGFLGNHVFICLHTGFEKSLCYYCLPLLYDKLYHRDTSTAIVIVVSPLIALMNDQTNTRPFQIFTCYTYTLLIVRLESNVTSCDIFPQFWA